MALIVSKSQIANNHKSLFCNVRIAFNWPLWLLAVFFS